MDTLSSHTTTKAWGMQPVWKPVVAPKKHNDFVSMTPYHSSSLVRSVEIKLVGPLRSKIDSSPTFARSSYSPENRHRSSYSSEEDEIEPKTVADVRNIIQKRRNSFQRRQDGIYRRLLSLDDSTWRSNRFSSSPESELSEFTSSDESKFEDATRRVSHKPNGGGVATIEIPPVLPAKTVHRESRPVIRRRALSENNESRAPSLPRKKNSDPIHQRRETVERKTSLDDSAFVRDGHKKKDSGSFFSRSSLRGSQKKSHAADHQRNLLSISKFLHGPKEPTLPPTVPVPPGVLKKPGADKGHRSMKKVAFLENAEFSRGIP